MLCPYVAQGVWACQRRMIALKDEYLELVLEGKADSIKGSAIDPATIMRALAFNCSSLSVKVAYSSLGTGCKPERCQCQNADLRPFSALGECFAEG